MNETNLASIVLGIVAGFYSTIFLLCLSDVVHLNKEMTKMKSELADIKNIYSNRTSIINDSINNISFISKSKKELEGQLCLSYTEQRQILDYINFVCNMAILFFGGYSIYVYGLGTQHGLPYRLFFFVCKILTIIGSVWLNLYFKQGLPSDIFLYMWIDVNCVASIYRSILQSLLKMPSTFLNHLRMMFRTTTVNRELALANNYTYVNEDKISRSLICPICLDPLIDPQTHISCENSFCNRCIRKLRQCPCCRASIINPNDLKMTSHVLRNILDELEVQCNVCKQTLCRGNFSIHIRNNCLDHSPISCEEEESLMNLSTPSSSVLNSPTTNKTFLDEQQIEKHLSNLYRRIHTLETELFELKKAIYICLFVLSTIATLIFFGSIFSYIIFSFLSVVFTQWLPSLIDSLTRFLFDFSPLITLFRIIFIGLYFFLICYKRRPSDINLLTIIICLIIVVFNFLILILHLIINHFNFLLLMSIMIMMGKYFHIQLPNNEQIVAFFNDIWINQQQQRRRRSD